MKTSIIPVFIPHLGCPHRCVFCDQHTVTGQAEVPTGADTAQKIATYTRKKGAAYEVAFYEVLLQPYRQLFKKNYCSRLMKLCKMDLCQPFVVRLGPIV